LSNNNKTLEKINSTRWFVVYGKKVFKSGIYKWALRIDLYTKTDYSGINWGVISPKHKTTSENQYAKIQNGESWGIGGS